MELLARYAHGHAEDAFAEIVRRHLGLVYSAALRQVRSPQLAEEVAQSTFIDLARNAARLKPDTVLTGWLYQVTHRTAIDVVRREASRQLREQIASEMNAMNAHAADWTHIEPLLDEAMQALDNTDRTAVLLRYFENKSLREVGATLGTTDEAARKRVNRAVERLREFFAKRGVTVGASGLVLVISTRGVQAAPVGLAAAISTAAALSGTTLVAITTATAIKTVIMTATRKTLITLTLLALLSITTYKVYHANEPRSESLQAGARLETNTALPGKSARRSGSIGSVFNRDGEATPADHVKLTADLRAALHDVPRSTRGTRSYPPENVMRALLAFGSDRREAFVTLEEAVNDSDQEVRMRAISAMGLVGMPSTPQAAQVGIVGDPAPEAKPLLWKTLLENDPKLAPMALSSLRNIGFEASEIPHLTELMTQTDNDQLRRYLPEAIAKTIQTEPAAAAPYVSILESLLNNSTPEIQFEAACALAKYGAAGNPQILATLVEGLKGTSSLQQLMALETLQGLGSVAEPTLQAILDFGDGTMDKVMKDVAFKTMANIKSELRSEFAEVEQALKHETSTANWNEKFASGNYTRQDLIDALKEPMFSVTAATKLVELGSQAKETVPNLISALAGQDQTSRERIVEAIQLIDPQAAIVKVEFKTIASASLAASMTLEAKPDQTKATPTPLEELLQKSMMGNSEWQTQQEVVTLAKAIAAQNQKAYRAFADKLLEVEPNMASLIPKPTAK